MNKELLKLNRDLIEQIEKYTDGIPMGEWSQSKSFLIFAFCEVLYNDQLYSIAV